MLTGPGISRARFYHIMGDLISTHMGPLAAQVIRVAKDDRKFGVLYPHSSSRFLASDGPWEYITANDEDVAWQKYGQGITEAGGRFVKGVITFSNLIRMKRLPANTPIPGSRRWERQMR